MVISPALYDTRDGRCLNELVDEWGGQKPPADPNWEYTKEIREEEARQKQWGKAPRGCELFLVDDDVEQPRAMAVGTNAVVVAGKLDQSAETATGSMLTALLLENGRELWSQSLPAAPAWWGLATDRVGRIVVTLQDGSVICLVSSDYGSHR